MSWDDNVYYHPEKSGLVQVAEVDLDEANYSFDLLAVWSDEQGLYLATDSGCSCPTPFENYAGKSDLTGPLTLDQALEEASNIKAAHYNPQYDLKAWNEFIESLRVFQGKGKTS